VPWLAALFGTATVGMEPETRQITSHVSATLRGREVAGRAEEPRTLAGALPRGGGKAKGLAVFRVLADASLTADLTMQISLDQGLTRPF